VGNYWTLGKPKAFSVRTPSVQYRLNA